MNLSDLRPFAQLAIRLAQTYGLELRISSKWTIAKSEQLFMERITAVFDEAGVSYQKLLTDVAFATMATQHEGGWLWLFDNPNGDSAADIVDWIDGSRSMCSTVFCLDGSCYEELPGGTAPDKFGTDLVGDNFFNPIGIINAFCSALLVANPSETDFVNRVRERAAQYLFCIHPDEYSTKEMVWEIAQSVAVHA
jgi:isocitrate dehydrogenase